MKIAIVSDSNSGITMTEAEELGFYILPTPILINGDVYYEDINLAHDDFYKNLSGKNITQDEFYVHLTGTSQVTTSQPNTYDAETLWTKLLQSYDQVIYFPISSGLSTTCFNLLQVAKEKYEGKVFVIDNKRVSITLRQSMMDAKKMADEGKTGEEIEKWLMDTRMQSSIYIMVPTLTYLKKTGRLNATEAFFGNMLKIKPILTIQGEKLDQFKKVRKTSEAKQVMIEALKNDLETRFKEQYEAGQMVTAIAHTQNLAEAEKFAEEIKEAIPKCEFYCINPLNLSVAVHTGPGALACGCIIRY